MGETNAHPAGCGWVLAFGPVLSFSDPRPAGCAACASAPALMITAQQWSSFTRLETRTKESNVCASAVVMETTTRIERDLPLIAPHRALQVHRGTCKRGRSLLIGKGYELKHRRWDPKDGDLFLNRAKTEETSLEARSGTDVQIVRRIWVKGRKTHRTV